MRFGPWLKLVAENGFRIHPLRIPLAFMISLITPTISGLALLQRLAYARRIHSTHVERPPLFIIGHWRSGTTFLHELMVMDPEHTFPTTYQCFAPEHFLVSQWLFGRYFGFLIPGRRPMDNVRAGFGRPQEDEFALLSMGQRTPYRRMAFPNNGPCDLDYLDMDNLSTEALEQWTGALRYFCQALTVNCPRRIVLKSPTHTGRVALLSQIFPGAQFIHITRHPYSLYPSTMRLWKSLDSVQGCQIPRHKALEEYVFAAFERMYSGLHAQRANFGPSQIVDLRYEDLVADPVGQIEQIYEQLGLGEFSAMRGKLESYVSGQPAFRTNEYRLDDATRAKIQSRWADYFERYDYEA